MFQEGEEVLIRGRDGWINGYYVWEPSDGPSVCLMTPGGSLINRRTDCVKHIPEEVDVGWVCKLLRSIPVSYPDPENFGCGPPTRFEWCR